MLKKVAYISGAIALLALVVACAPAKYTDLNDSLKRIILASDKLAADMDKATDSKTVVSAITSYANVLKAEQKLTDEFGKKYPELKEDSFAEAMQADKAKFEERAKANPKLNELKDLRETVEKLQSQTGKFMAVMSKLQTYAEDKDVQDAMQKLIGES